MIYMSDKDFDFENLETHIAGGGILPVSIFNNQVKILLGKERYINHWRGSLKWSGFEGGRKVSETINDTACREFIEESLSALELTNESENTIPYKEQIQKIINDKEYFMRIILCINHENGGHIDKRYHVTYVLEVPFQMECIERFNNTRKKLIDLHYRLTQFQKIYEQLSEHEYPIIMKNDVIHGNVVKAISKVRLQDDQITILYMDDDGEKQIHETCSEAQKETAITYTKWWCAREQLHKDVAYFKYLKNSVHIKYDLLGLFEDATINDEYLEKQHIQWWDIADLKDVIKNGGYTKNDFFRAYFLPVLQRTVQELEKYYPQRDHNS